MCLALKADVPRAAHCTDRGQPVAFESDVGPPAFLTLDGCLGSRVCKYSTRNELSSMTTSCHALYAIYLGSGGVLLPQEAGRNCVFTRS